jgi:alpha-mannosidase
MDGRGEYRRGRFSSASFLRVNTSPSSMALEAHVVTHTHWDREWYHPVERFRQRLVGLVDELLADRPSPDESFLLDGQAIVIDDYLAVRPERGAELASLLRDGSIEAGPWYVLADELIPSGEALVRNLLTGRRVLAGFGAQAPPVLYCPDSFGHPAALPSLAAGFGLPLVILWRGYGGARWPAGDTVRWVAPSGDASLLFHLPRDGYEFGSHLPLDELAAAARWQRMRVELVPRSVTGVLFIPNGADHHARQLHFRDALSALERAGAADNVHRSSLRHFAERVVECGAERELPVVRGELRDSYGYTWSLQGTFATRAHEKRANARAERQLLREAEPWSALAARAGSSRRPLLDAAWRTLLQAHPHDTLCGCSIDEVARAMELRILSATNQAAGVVDDSLADLIGHDAVAARTARDDWTPIVVVRNAAPRGRSGVAILDVEEFLADVAVGPGSAPTDVPPIVAPLGKPRIPSLGVIQVLSRRLAQSRTESPRHYPDNDLVRVSRVAAWVDDAEPFGVHSFAIGHGAPGKSGRRRPAPVGTEARALHNGQLIVRVSEAGAVSLEDIATGRRIESLLDFVDDADVGDLYTPAPRPRPSSIEFRGVRRTHRGPLRGELELRFRVVDQSSTRATVTAELIVRLVLDAGAAFLRIGVAGNNRGTNHRLRLLIRTGVANRELWADAAFGLVKRDPLVISEAESRVEHAPKTAPLHRYVSLFDHRAGATVFSDGLAEYEAYDDGTVAITLVRAVGELSKNDLPERPGHAGWPVPTPGAQCLGPFDAELGVLLHGTRTTATIDAIEQAADDVLCPLIGTTLRSALHVPPPVAGPELVGGGLAFSTMKESEDGEWLVLRCVNLTDDEVDGRWRLPFDPRSARVARLDETVMSELIPTGRDLVFRAAPRAIVTVLVR